MMREMTGADAIVDALVANGIETLFGLPGGQLDHLFDAIYRARPGPRLIHTRHEQGAAYMAFGYAQSTGKVGAYTVVPGPGLLNSTAALCTAWACGAPVLAISGQVHLKGIDRRDAARCRLSRDHSPPGPLARTDRRGRLRRDAPGRDGPDGEPNRHLPGRQQPFLSQGHDRTLAWRLS
jgi:glyoxylate carboligase